MMSAQLSKNKKIKQTAATAQPGVTRLGIIGYGKMGEAIAQGLAHRKDIAISATTRSEASAAEVDSNGGRIQCHTDNVRLVEESDILLLAVKPRQAEEVLKSVAGQIRSEQLLISICASISTSEIAALIKRRCPVVRAMPNTPCLIRKGMTALAPGVGVSREQLERAVSLFEPVGLTEIIEEDLFDGVTGLSGCGPAYVYLVIEALSEAGVKIGLARETATRMAAQTLLGASQMVLERDVHPAALKDEVTTPAGCTIDGLMALEEGRLRVTLIRGVLAAAKRSKALRDSK